MAQEKRHYFETSKPNNRVRVYHGDLLLADTNDPLLLKEVGTSVYDPVYYFPREDVKLELLQGNDHQTHCPIKGDASYFDLTASSDPVEHIAWSYEDPVQDSEPLAGRIAFYGNKVSFRIEPR